VRSALEDAALADLLGQTRWGELDWLLIDLAPGADRLPALARLSSRIDGALAVTIPTEVSLLAVERSMRRVLDARIALLGLVENLSSVVCPHCGREHGLFHEASAERLARELDVPLLARIPFDARLAAAADAGRPFLGVGRDPAEAPSPAAAAFAKLAEPVAAWQPARDGGGR
jgi:ATP-binding protein involved in chromosome partitioning